MSPDPQPTHSKIELALEGILFASRWIMAPFYLGLAAGLVVLLVKFAQKAFDVAIHAITLDNNDIIIGLLSLIDLSLIGNLMIMVIFTGFENFVSRFNLDDHRDKPDWMGHVGFSELKIKLMTSIIAISAIHLLEAFMNIDEVSNRDIAWLVGLHLAFVTSGVLLAVMDRVLRKP